MTKAKKIRITTGEVVTIGEVNKAFDEFSKNIKPEQDCELILEVDDTFEPNEIKITVDEN